MIIKRLICLKFFANILLTCAIGLVACTNTQPQIDLLSSAKDAIAATSIEVYSGNAQTDIVASTLANPFIVVVKDSNSNLISGAIVDWTISTGGGTLSNSVSVTDSDGQAQGSLTLGSLIGVNTVIATVRNTLLTKIFSATGMHGAGARLIFTTSPDTTQVGTTFLQQPVVKIKDVYGNFVTTGPDATANIAITLTTGAGSLSGVTTVPAAGGVANFAGLSVNVAGAADILTATATLSSNSVTVTSAPFFIYDTLTINAPSITIPILNAYSYPFVASGGVPPYTFSGTDVTAGGAYAPTGTTTGTSNVTVTDGLGNSVTSVIALVKNLTNNSASLVSLTDGSGNTYYGGRFTGVYPYSAPNLFAVDMQTGNPELAFDLKSGFNGIVRAIVRDPNSGAVYVGGQFTQYRGSAVPFLVKLNAKGEIDTTFKSFTLNTNVFALALSSDGQSIFVGGAFSSYSRAGVPTAVNFIMKLSTVDGALTTDGFNGGGGFNGDVNALALDATGNLYVGGVFTTYRSLSMKQIVKLSSADGLPKTENINTGAGFTANGTALAKVNALALDSSGNIFVGGDFISYRGTSLSCIAKLDVITGNLVGGFSAGVGFAGTIDATGDTNRRYVAALVFDPAGYLYVGGYFGAYRGTVANHLIKINAADGAIDTTFYTDPALSSGGFNNVVRALVLDSTDQTLYVGGSFTSYRGVTDFTNRVAKLSTVNGALKSDFHSSASGKVSFSWDVYSLEFDRSKTLLYVGGDFKYYGGVAQRRISKISSTGVVDLGFHLNTMTDGFSNSVTNLAIATGALAVTVPAGSTYRGSPFTAPFKLDLNNGSIVP